MYSISKLFRNHAHTNLKNCSLVRELDESAQGTGFAFIVMAEVFTKIPGAPFWSSLFFLMLLSLGLGSQIGILEGVMSTLFDQPSLRHVKKPVLVGCVSVVCFCVGIIFTTGAGEYWLTLFDTFGATGLTFIAFTELVSVMYVYGHKRFTQDIKNMTGGNSISLNKENISCSRVPTKPVLANNVEIHLPHLHGHCHHLQCVLHAVRYSYLHCLEPTKGELQL